MRRKIVAGNWKLHGSRQFANELLGQVAAGLPLEGVDVVILPPLPYLGELVEDFGETSLAFGAQDVSSNEKGAYTGEVCAAIVSGLVGPDAPDAERWETLWHYMQGGPGVFKGDLYFYKLDGDIRDRVAQIDTSRCPLFLLSGEYDYSCTPEETLAVANSIKGSHVTIMKGLGHFPMSEDPEKFLGYLLPVLKTID